MSSRVEFQEPDVGLGGDAAECWQTESALRFTLNRNSQPDQTTRNLAWAESACQSAAFCSPQSRLMDGYSSLSRIQCELSPIRGHRLDFLNPERSCSGLHVGAHLEMKDSDGTAHNRLLATSEYTDIQVALLSGASDQLAG